jgi:antitoxin ParD1/3/4
MTATESRLKTWEIILPRDLCEYVEEMITKKQFGSADSLIASALYAFRDVAEANRIKHERLRADLQIGIDQLERGEYVDGDEMFARLHKKLDDAGAKKA